MKRLNLVSIVILLFALKANAASFDCAKAKSFIEKEICSNQNLGSFDEELSDLYKRAISSRNNAPEITAEQRKWLRETRNICSDSACLIKAYQVRIKELQASLLNQTTSKGIDLVEPVFELTAQELKNDIPETPLKPSSTKYLNDFKLFYKRFQYLVVNNKKEEISKLVKFPINKKIKNSKLFMDNFEDIFDKEMRMVIGNVDYSELYALKGKFYIGKYGYAITVESIGKAGAPHKFVISSMDYKNNRDE